ncbi:glycosyltransferase [Marinomonas shanghaiensis]|uniref:glycosyltransferase n=1 Tax=Marinomonas shanghaiensis TaxID=2202418 RepID=UPI003A92FAC2
MSTSLMEVCTKNLSEKVYYSHALNNKTYDFFEKLFISEEIAKEETQNLKNSILEKSDREVINKHIEDNKDITIISGIRDPIDRALSLIAQNLNGLFFDADDQTDEDTVSRLKKEFEFFWDDTPNKSTIKEKFIEDMIKADQWWFNQELEESFSIDLLDTPFNRELGYSIYRKKNVTLLFFKYENGTTLLESGLSRIFPNVSFKIPFKNAASQKKSHSIYNALKNEVRLPKDFLEKIYSSSLIKHFYDKSEIEEAKEKWMKRDEMYPSITSKYSITPTACILIPLHNHAQWIKKQLTSIFDQWRNDLELLLIDDGSTDKGLEVALELISQRTEINSTVMRFEKAQGLGLVNQIIKYTNASIIIQCDSDDYCLPNRINKILDCFKNDPSCRLVTSNALLISEEHIPLTLYDCFHKETILTDSSELVDKWHAPYYLGATSAFHRSIIEDFPPFNEDLCPYGFDLITPLRALLLGSHHYIPTPLVAWRQHKHNTHKTAGAGSSDLTQKEHYLSLELRCLAQRVRDIEHALQEQKAQNSEVVLKTLEKCNKHFQQSFDLWSITRKELDNGRSAGYEDHKKLKLSVPPLQSLVKNTLYTYDYNSPLSRVSAQWSGFHDPEANWIWTSYLSMIAFQIPDPTIKELRLTFSTTELQKKQKISFYINSDLIKTISTEGGKPISISLPLRGRTTHNITTLMTQAHNAISPKEFDTKLEDERVLGLCLISLEVI